MSTFDVVDEHDEPLQRIASYDEVYREGLWHRGVHIIIYTPDKDIVMQKRAPTLNYHPNEIEISVGGGVEAGEQPLDAAVRESKEELGITIDKSKVQFIDKTKFNHTVHGQHHRIFLYTYAVCVPKHDLTFSIDQTETTVAFLISRRKLQRALTKHRIKQFGRISSLYAYWNHMLQVV